MEILFSFLGGVVIAIIIAVLVTRNIIKSKVSQAEQTAKMQMETAFKVEQTKLEAELEHSKQRNEELLKAIDDAKEEWRKRNIEDIAAHDTAHKEAMEVLQKRFDETINKVSAQVKADTGEMLKARQKEFSESSNESIGQIVKPLKENIAELKKAMEEGSKEQAERSGEMREQIRNLMKQSDAARKSADDLAAAFKHGSKIQGDWGETVLEELLSSQGLTNGVHFETQSVIRTDDGRLLRPDVILHLDDRRDVIIDSKVSLTAYIDYVNAETEAERNAHLKAHIESIKKHVKELAEKDYSSYIKPPKVTAGYVIMFVPMAGALWTALNSEPDLWRTAANKNVYITDEQSLFGALKIVKMTWTQIVQAQNQEKVFELANEMIDRVGLFMKHYDALGAALDKASTAYSNGKDKLSPTGHSIITTANKLIKLGAKNGSKNPIKTISEASDDAYSHSIVAGGLDEMS